jgi:hypothetical protein
MPIERSVLGPAVRTRKTAVFIFIEVGGEIEMKGSLMVGRLRFIYLCICLGLCATQTTYDAPDVGRAVTELHLQDIIRYH